MPYGISRLGRSLVPLLIPLIWLGAESPARASIILYTASTDNTGGVAPQSVPSVNNMNLPPIDPGVTINPNPAFLDGNTVGPINGITYGPFGFVGNTGGTTGFVSVSYTIAVSGLYQLTWEVGDAIDHSRVSALAIDNVQLGGALLYGFESGIPAGFASLGSVGTSTAVLDLAPTQGSSFAYLDTTGNSPVIYDTVDGTEGSQLISSPFAATAGQILSLDMAFLTNDGGPFDDYGIAVLDVVVPEPSALAMALIAAVTGVAVQLWRRR